MIEYKEKTLKNGLRVIVNKDDNTELVAVNILYKVGSKDESEDHTGFAHLFEHLMFSGSKNYPDFDSLINSLGGESNAFTNCDITNFYISVPYIYLETILRAEADRMRNLIIDDYHLDVQKKVVCEEFKQRYLNHPYGDLSKQMKDLSYKVHPYKWQTIGKDISHIEGATLDIVRKFYDDYYKPDNAVLCVSGKAEPEQVFELTEKIFDFDCPPCVKKERIVEPIQTENRLRKVYRDVPANVIVITFPMCGRKEHNFYVMDLISDLLSNGTSSRMYNRLVQELKLFVSIEAVVSGDDDEGLFIVMGKYADSVDIDRGEEQIWKVLRSLTEEGIDDRELKKVKNKNLVASTFSNIKILDKAANLAYYDHLDILSAINNQSKIYQAIGKDEIVDLADKTFFKAKHNTLYYLRKEEKDK